MKHILITLLTLLVLTGCQITSQQTERSRIAFNDFTFEKCEFLNTTHNGFTISTTEEHSICKGEIIIPQLNQINLDKNFRISFNTNIDIQDGITSISLFHPEFNISINSQSGEKNFFGQHCLSWLYDCPEQEKREIKLVFDWFDNIQNSNEYTIQKTGNEITLFLNQQEIGSFQLNENNLDSIKMFVSLNKNTIIHFNNINFN